MTLSVEEARAALAARLGERSYAHSVAVAETATRIADAYDLDRDEAYLAGLLHDWAREVASHVLLEDAAAHGLGITDVDEAVPYLLHARVGARAVREALPGVPERVVNAIEHHTTGSPGMDKLDMVLYLADMLEPAREFESAERLRAAIGEIPLEELYEQAYANSFIHLIERRKRLHPAAVAAWNAIVDNRRRR